MARNRHVLIEARRIRAAMAYAEIRNGNGNDRELLDDEIKDQLAEYVSARTVERWRRAGVTNSRPVNRQAVARLAELSGLPEAFFYADLSRLDELVPAQRPASTTREDAADQRGIAQARQAADRRAAQPDADRRQGRPDRRTG